MKRPSENSLESIMWSVFRKQNVQAKEIYSKEDESIFGNGFKGFALIPPLLKDRPTL